MFNTTFVVRPVPGTDKVVVGMTPKSVASLFVKTTVWSLAPVLGLIVISEYMDYRDTKKPTNTEDHYTEQ